MAREKRKRRGCLGCLSALFKLALVLTVLWAMATLYLNGIIGSGLNPENTPFGGGPINLSVQGGLGGQWTNILLLGRDSRDSGVNGLTDTMIVVSVNALSGRVKMTSLMRDTMVSIPGYGSGKLNAAHAHGGPMLAIKTVNESFGLNIQKYASVDFFSFPQIIDSIGGIEVNVLPEEVEYVNHNIRAERKIWRNLGLDTTELTQSGKNTHLTGVQALAYSRIRKLDSDYKRAGRQRAVMDAMLKKVRGVRNPLALYNLGTTLLRYVDTNIGIGEMGTIGVSALRADGFEEYRVPVDGTFDSGTQNGVWSIRADLEKNRQLLRAFIYEN